MLDNLLDPVVLCFAAGLLAGVLRSDLRIPDAAYQTLSIYLLLAIGLKGGVQLARSDLGALVVPLLVTLALGVIIPLLAYVALRRLGRFGVADAAALAAHYGSVSAVTFAVALAYLQNLGVGYEPYVTVLLVVLEVPAIAVGITIARVKLAEGPTRLRPLAHEILLGKSIFLLLGGLAIGWAAGPERLEPVKPFFFDLFRGVLAIFLLEMGLIASRRLGELRAVGLFLIAFAILMPLVSATLGALAAKLAGLSVGGATMLAVLAGSASYIAAPAAMRMAVPQANPTLYLTASLAITFPFNLVVGIPLYHTLATWIVGA
ncbi:MAG: sodium-dependent bicarbonate transport family permease [Deltaproteobacteria bacterium]|nr:sodium-dependent bicarbonate transport family permease [Deltaproteobacteria bacterium]